MASVFVEVENTKHIQKEKTPDKKDNIKEPSTNTETKPFTHALPIHVAALHLIKDFCDSTSFHLLNHVSRENECSKKEGLTKLALLKKCTLLLVFMTSLGK